MSGGGGCKAELERGREVCEVERQHRRLVAEGIAPLGIGERLADIMMHGKHEGLHTQTL